SDSAHRSLPSFPTRRSSDLVLGAADDVQRAQGFPDLFVAGSDDGDCLTGGDAGSRGGRERVDAAADRRAQIRPLFGAVAEFGDDAALMDGGAWSVCVDDMTAEWGDDVNRLEQRHDLRAARCVAEAHQRECRVAPHYGPR